MAAFALAYAEPRQAEVPPPYAFDPEQQVNVLPGGEKASEDLVILMSTGATSSTAGSKTHNDDD
jgi:putative ATP-grasp target RiPP